MGRRSFAEITDSEDSDYDSESDEQSDDESDDSDDASEEESFCFDSDEDDGSEYEYYYYDHDDEECDGEMEVFTYSEEVEEELVVLSRVKKTKKQRGGTSKLSKKSKIRATKKGATRSKTSVKKDVIRKPLQKKISKKNSRSTTTSRGSISSCRKNPATTRSRKGKGKATPAKRVVANDKKKKKQLVNRPITFLVFDLETTGFHRIYDRIIEIALVDIDDGGQNTFHSLVNPGCPITNSHIHGITTNMVNRLGVPRMQGLIPSLLQFVKSRKKPRGYVVLVAHNARCFDVPFLLNEFKRCSTPIPSNWLFLDTLPLAREVMKSTGSQVRGRISLQALREHYGVPLVGSAHTAISDVHSLSEVLQRIAIDLNLSTADLLHKTFTVKDLTIAKLKKEQDRN